MIRTSLAAAALLLATPGAAQELTVYSSRSHYGAESVFEDFTKATGVAIRFFNGNNNEVFERLRAEGAATRADLLLTVDAGNLWNAAREGLLAPVRSPALEANVPAHLRDPEGRWYGIAVRARTLVYSSERVDPRTLAGLESLAAPRFKGRLCLRSSNSVYNQSLLGARIGALGEAKVEALVRGWIANDPVYFDGDTKLVEAIAAGRCDAGIVNHYYLARLLDKDPKLPVALHWPAAAQGGVHVNVSGAGVTRHAKNPAAALRLLEYLTTPEAQERLAGGSFEFPANPAAKPHPSIRGWAGFEPEKVGVAACGEFQAAAVKLADRAGYR